MSQVPGIWRQKAPQLPSRKLHYRSRLNSKTLFPSRFLCIIITVWRVGSTLGAVEPARNVSEQEVETMGESERTIQYASTAFELLYPSAEPSSSSSSFSI